MLLLLLVLKFNVWCLILGLEGVISEQETRLTAAEENIQSTKHSVFIVLNSFCQAFELWRNELKLHTIAAPENKNEIKYCKTTLFINNFVRYQIILGLQMTDDELDARVTTLEENGGGDTQNGKTDYSQIRI